MENRVCKICQVQKPIGEFRHKTKTAYNTICRPCEAIKSLEYYHANKDRAGFAEARKVKNEKWYAENGRTPETRQQGRETYYRHREKILKQNKAKRLAGLMPAWKPRGELKEKCHALFEYAMKTGRVQKQPCSVCGTLKAEGHHPDYFKPLEVVWLCLKHHREIHRKDFVSFNQPT